MQQLFTFLCAPTRNQIFLSPIQASDRLVGVKLLIALILNLFYVSLMFASVSFVNDVVTLFYFTFDCNCILISDFVCLLFCLICDLASQSTAMVMSGRFLHFMGLLPKIKTS